MTPRKYIFIIGALSFGGAERVISNLANEFSAIKDDVHLISLHNREIVYKISGNVKVTNGLKGNTAFNKGMHLRRILKKENPDAVVSFMTHVNIFTLLTSIGLGLKVFISERSNPYIVPTQKYRKLLRSIIYPLAHGFVFQTKEARDYFSGNIARKSRIIHNPVIISQEILTLEKSKRIVNIGRLIKSKKQDFLINAFKKLHKEYPAYTLEIYGEGPEQENLQKKIIDLGLENSVKLRGVSSNLHIDISDASMFILTSEYEGMPNALMEAMALGIPSISTDCPIGGPQSLINHMENGILTSINDEDELVNYMKLLIEDKKLSEAISFQGQNIRTSHSPSKIAQEWKDFIDGL